MAAPEPGLSRRFARRCVWGAVSGTVSTTQLSVTPGDCRLSLEKGWIRTGRSEREPGITSTLLRYRLQDYPPAASSTSRKSLSAGCRKPVV
jgi:hypothetical protein